MSSIDLFSGCGGASLGFSAAGFTPRGAVEIDEAAATAYESNLGVRPLVKNIQRVTGGELLRSAGLGAGECTLLSGCPPCQSYTSLRHGSKSSRLDRRRNSLYLDYLRLAEAVHPRHIAFENVPGMLSSRWKPRFDSMLEGLAQLGYASTWAVIDAADYGVPQHRRRLVVFASRVADPALPKPTHSGSPGPGYRRHRTVRDGIGSLLPLNSGEGHPTDSYHRARSHTPLAIERLRAIPEGGGRTDLPPRLQLECHKDHDGHYDIYGRMRWDQPAPTLTSGCTNVTRGRFGHPDQDRAITLREAMLLQSFPRKAVLHGTSGDMSLQIGNAIPPVLAQRLGEAIMAMEASSRRS
jgi:DNA (cytosine-5)-methyltransferase 1